MLQKYKRSFILIISDYRTILLVALLVRICAAFAFVGRYHPDETSRGLEMAYYLINDRNTFFKSDFYEQEQLWTYMWPALLSPFIWTGIKLGLGGLKIFTFIRSLMGLLSIVIIPISQRFYQDGTVEGQQRSVLVGWIVALFWPFVFFGVQVIADAISLILLVMTLPLIERVIKQTSSRKEEVLLGILISLTISFRLSTGVIFLPFLAYIFYKKHYMVIFGIILGFVPYALFDWVYYGIPMISMYNFLDYNVLGDGFYLSVYRPWWFYIVLIPVLVFGVIGIFYYSWLLRWGWSYLMEERKMGMTLLGMGMFTVIHLMLSYKEIRFLLPVLCLFVIFSASGAPTLVKKWKKSPRSMIIKLATFFMIVFSISSLFVLPYDGFANMWRAQEYVRKIDPDATVAIEATYWSTGGHLLQHPDTKDGDLLLLHPIFQDYIRSNNISLDFVILNSNAQDYENASDFVETWCGNLHLIKEFNDVRWISIYTYFGNSPVYLAEVYTCDYVL